MASEAETAINAFAGADHGGRPAPGNLVQHLQRDLHIMLLVASQRAADGIEQKALGLIHGLLRELLVGHPAAQRDILAVMVSLAAVSFLDASVADTNSPISTRIRTLFRTRRMFFGFLNGKNAMKSAWCTM